MHVALARAVEAAQGLPGETELLRIVIDSITDGVYVVTPDRRIVLWNKAAERLTGYSAAEVVGRRCGEDLLKHVDDGGCVVCGRTCPLRGVRDGLEAAGEPVALHCLHRDGHRLPVRVHAAPLVAADGTVVGAVEVFRDDTADRALRTKIDELIEEARTDSLTRLANRRRLEEALDVALYSFERYGHPFAFALFDLDRFKAINDTHGHDAGDAVLRAIARTVEALLRKADLAARWGGEEFALVLPEIGDEETLFTVLDRLRAVVGRVRVPFRRAVIDPTVSVGATLARPGDTLPDLLRRADEALYASKREGRDRVSVR